MVKEITDSFLHLLFPHTCSGCGSDILNKESMLCLHCLDGLPGTHFEKLPNNPVEKKFWGRLPLHQAMAQYFFTGGSLMQQIIHQVKYNGNRELGLQLGRMMGAVLKQSGRYGADALIPLPLFPDKQKRRGFNQTDLLCDGMAEQMNIPVLKKTISRPQHTETQTKKGRIERWTNMEGKFVLTDPAAIAGKHIILVDDVITTGATLESCGLELLKARDVNLSVACLCYAAR